MTPNNRTLKYISLAVSIVLHAILFFISFPYIKMAVSDAEPTLYSVPVSLSMSAPPTPEPTPKALPAPPPPKTPPQKRAQLTPPPAPPAKPSPVQTPQASAKPVSSTTLTGTESVPSELPGDRKSAIPSSPIVPVYPKYALNFEWTGTVIAEFAIDETGKVVRHRLIRTSGHDILDESFIRSVTSRHFEPKRVLGKTVSDTIQLRHDYKLR
ncbi:MAG: energy transducer TonB [Candidatus Margulisbacteria bacterium]|nr:energy transducer TonB [Candidatus Margulisiibacteriota bacterium]